MISDANQLPKDWKYVRLGDYISKVGSGITPRGGESVYLKSGIPLIRSQNVHINRFEMSGLAFISPQQDEEMKDTRVLPGDVLLNITGASIGRVCVVPRKLCPANVNQHVCIIRTNGKINPVFLSLFISTPDFQRFIADNQSGATRQALTKSQIEDFQIPLPPLAEQKRIAAILEKCDRLRRTRRYALQLSDTFLQSVFLEMFGDPVTNPRGWDVFELESQVEHIDSGWSPVCEEYPRTTSEQWAVLKLGAVTWGIYQYNENKLLPYNLKPRPDLEVKKGDILITRKNTIDLVAACAFVHQTPPRLMLPDTIFRFSLKKYCQVKPEYLWGLFNEKLFRTKVQSLATGTAGSMPNISKEKLLAVLLPIPPLPLQEKFAQIVQKFERFRNQQREAERQAEHLFQTLLHRAFRGELTSSDFNDEAVSVLSQEIRAQQPKPNATDDTAEYLRTKAKPQDTEAIQLTLPGLE